MLGDKMSGNIIYYDPFYSFILFIFEMIVNDEDNVFGSYLGRS